MIENKGLLWTLTQQFISRSEEGNALRASSSRNPERIDKQKLFCCNEPKSSQRTLLSQVVSRRVDIHFSPAVKPKPRTIEHVSKELSALTRTNITHKTWINSWINV